MVMIKGSKGGGLLGNGPPARKRRERYTRRRRERLRRIKNATPGTHPCQNPAYKWASEVKRMAFKERAEAIRYAVHEHPREYVEELLRWKPLEVTLREYIEQHMRRRR